MPVELDATAANLVDVVWQRLRPDIAQRRRRYSWPPGCSFEESVHLRDHLEACIERDVSSSGALSVETFRKVMYWGFGQSSSAITADRIHAASTEAFRAVSQGRLSEAVLALLALPKVGPSRATKLIALANQATMGIYDSSVAAALNASAGGELVPVPPAQGSVGPHPSQKRLAEGFVIYTNVLRALHGKAEAEVELATDFPKVRDIELALFAPAA